MRNFIALALLVALFFVSFSFLNYVSAATLSPNVFIIQDDGTFIRSGYAASDYGMIDVSGSIVKEVAIKKFFQDNPNAKNLYDFVIFATNFKPGDNIGQFTPTKKDIKGTSDSNGDINLANTYNNTGLTGGEKFQGYAFIANINDLTDDLYLPIHEMSHRWIFRLGDYDSCGKGFGCTKETGFKINNNGSHYNEKINTITTDKGKSYKDPNGGGTLVAAPTPGYCLDFGGGSDGYRFSSISLYLMGLIPADQVAPLKWYITSSTWSDKGIPCVEKTFSTQDIVSLVGQRNPAYPNTQKNFSVAYLLLTKQGQTPAIVEINKMNLMAENFPKKWTEATMYKSTINNIAVTAPSTNTPTLTSFTTPSVIVDSTTTRKYDFGTVTLRNGSTGSGVVELQRFLNNRLHLGLVVDGKLGPKTIAVIKKWQMDHGLVVDGLVGAKTKALMNSGM